MAGRPRAGNTAIYGLLLGCLGLGTLVLLPACRQSGQEEGRSARSGASSASEGEWKWLQATKTRLDAQRARLAQLEAGTPKPANPADPATPADPANPADIARLRDGVSRLSVELNQRLVAFINDNATVAGIADDAGAAGTDGKTPGPRSPLNELDERLRAAIRMKSGEDALLAREFIEQGGDYRRAIEIYETALATDPDNESLRKELEAAKARRYISAARFKLVREAMKEDEVRRLLGPPNRQDVREYPERGVTAWFYPKDASGAAAAVWFHSKGANREVYLLDFDAIRPAGDPAPGATPPARGTPLGTPAPPAAPAPPPPTPPTTPVGA